MNHKVSPIRIQKAGEAPLHTPSKSVSSDSGEKKSFLTTPDSIAGAVTPPCEEESKVEVKEIEPGTFEITVTCGCGKKSVVRCESLVSAAA